MLRNELDGQECNDAEYQGSECERKCVPDADEHEGNHDAGEGGMTDGISDQTLALDYTDGSDDARCKGQYDCAECDDEEGVAG